MTPDDYDALCDALDSLEAGDATRAEGTIRRIVVEALLAAPGTPFVASLAPRLRADLEAPHPAVADLCSKEARRVEGQVIVPLGQAAPPRPPLDEMRSELRWIAAVQSVSWSASEQGGLVPWFEAVYAEIPAQVALSVNEAILSALAIREPR